MIQTVDLAGLVDEEYGISFPPEREQLSREWSRRKKKNNGDFRDQLVFDPREERGLVQWLINVKGILPLSVSPVAESVKEIYRREYGRHVLSSSYREIYRSALEFNHGYSYLDPVTNLLFPNQYLLRDWANHVINFGEGIMDHIGVPFDIVQEYILREKKLPLVFSPKPTAKSREQQRRLFREKHPKAMISSMEVFEVVLPSGYNKGLAIEARGVIESWEGGNLLVQPLYTGRIHGAQELTERQQSVLALFEGAKEIYATDSSEYILGPDAQEFFRILEDLSIGDDEDLSFKAQRLLESSRRELADQAIQQLDVFHSIARPEIIRELGVSVRSYDYLGQTESLNRVLSFFFPDHDLERFESSSYEGERISDAKALMEAGQLCFRDACLSNYKINWRRVDSLLKEENTFLYRVPFAIGTADDHRNTTESLLNGVLELDMDILARVIGGSMVSIDYSDRVGQLIVGPEDIVLMCDKTPGMGQDYDDIETYHDAFIERVIAISRSHSFSQEMVDRYMELRDLVRAYWNIRQADLHLLDENKGSMRTELVRLGQALIDKEYAVVGEAWDLLSAHFLYVQHHCAIANEAFRRAKEGSGAIFEAVGDAFSRPIKFSRLVEHSAGEAGQRGLDYLLQHKDQLPQKDNLPYTI